MVTHWDDVRGREVELGELQGRWRRLGRAAGSVAVAANRIDLPPGGRSTPVHSHTVEEELFFVLKGSGLSWQDGRTYRVEAGDCLLHLPDGPAHTLVAGDDGLSALAFGPGTRTEVGPLPRAGVAWVSSRTWVDLRPGDHPWQREAAAGPLELPEPEAERPPTIVALDDVPAERWGEGDVRTVQRDLGVATGSRAAGLNQVVVEPGALSAPPHCHSAEEELFVVLGGTGVVVLGDEEHAVREGSVVARPPGTRVAHAFRAGDGELELLAYGTRVAHDACFYPRSGKVALRGLGVRFRIEAVEYWEGEA
jgi:uncharacterized cupin superfamily protein